MALLLNIDTATEVASVCLSSKGNCIAFSKNDHQKEHASFVHAAVQHILKEAGVELKLVDGFAVTSGPGSYTGLRVGMATAKGFCYAFSKPLIAINTLKVMAKGALDTLSQLDENDVFCPMIDARRMEVFTAVYDRDLNNLLVPQPVVLQESSFDHLKINGKIIIFGSGSTKFKDIAKLENARFENIHSDANHLAALAEEAFQQKNFADVSYSEPNYFKDFHSTAKS